MKKHRRQMGLKPVLLLLFCCIIGSCNVREPGCLDIEAENFDFEADRHDESLCVYPNLVLNVLYQWSDSSLQLGFLYRNDHGMDYAIHNVQILYSGFILENADGESLMIDDRVDILPVSCDLTAAVSVPDDFLFVDRTTFNYVIGAFRESGLMDSTKVRIGVNEMLTPICISALPVTHPLRTTRAGYDEGVGEFALGRFVISRDSVNAVRDTIFAYGLSEELLFDVSRTFVQGKPDTLFMEIDFERIFSPVDLSQEETQIGNNLAALVAGAVIVR